MKLKFSSRLILTLAVVLTLSVLVSATAFAADAWDGSAVPMLLSGDGSQGNPYKISTGAELAYIAKEANKSEFPESFADKYFILTSNIDLNGHEWTPISRFNGKFDGSNYAINGIKIGSSSSYSISDSENGLFGSVDANAVIKNLSVDSGGIYSAANGAANGVIAGYNAGTITNCKTSGRINSTGNEVYIGGVVGYNNGGTITNCRTTSHILAGGRESFAGGLVGYNDGLVMASSATGEVITNKSGSRAGGLVGKNNSTNSAILDSNATGNVTSSGSESIASGLVGLNTGIVANCYATGTVKCAGDFAGAFVGSNTGSGAITNSFATGNVSGNTDDSCIGGFAGQNTESGKIRNCYYVGQMQDGNAIGGFIGYNSNILEYCYWQSNSVYISGGVGVGTDITHRKMFFSDLQAQEFTDTLNSNRALIDTDYPSAKWLRSDDYNNGLPYPEPSDLGGGLDPIVPPPSTTYTVRVSGSYIMGGDFTREHSVGDKVTLNCGMRDDYDFDGWLTVPAGIEIGEDGSFTMPASDVTVTGQWTLKTPALTIEINGVSGIKYSVDSHGTVTISPTVTQWDALIDTTENTVLDITVPAIEGMTGATIETHMGRILSRPELQTLIYNVLGVELSIPAVVLLSITENPQVLGFGLRAEPAVFTLTNSNGDPIDWYDYANPVTLSVPYESAALGSLHRLVMTTVTSDIIPRSWYDNGRVYARIYEPGVYGVSLQDSTGFTDTDGKWMGTAVGYMQARNIVNGVGGGLFDPQDTITRAHFVTMLMRALNVKATVEASKLPKDFAAIPSWAQEPVKAATALKLTLTDSAGNFKPDAPILRQEMFFMAFEAMRVCDMLPSSTPERTLSFSDWSSVKPEYEAAITRLYRLDLVNGNADGTLNPNGRSTRAEGAQFFYNILKFDSATTSEPEGGSLG